MISVAWVVQEAELGLPQGFRGRRARQQATIEVLHRENWDILRLFQVNLKEQRTQAS
jgi:hypothetical protein